MMWRSSSETWRDLGKHRRWVILALLMYVSWPATPLLAKSSPAAHDLTGDLVEIIHVLPQQIKAETTGELRIDLHFPEGYHLNPRAPLHYHLDVQGEGVHLAETDRRRDVIAPALPLVIPFQTRAGTHQSTATLDMTFYYCREDDTGVCVIQSVRWQIPLHTAPEQMTHQARVSYKAEVPVLQKPL